MINKRPNLRRAEQTPFSEQLPSPQRPESLEFSPVVPKHINSVRKANPRRALNLHSLKLSSSTDDILTELGLEVDLSDLPQPTEEAKVKQEAENLKVATEEVLRQIIAAYIQTENDLLEQMGDDEARLSVSASRPEFLKKLVDNPPHQ